MHYLLVINNEFYIKVSSSQPIKVQMRNENEAVGRQQTQPMKQTNASTVKSRTQLVRERGTEMQTQQIPLKNSFDALLSIEQ